MLIWTADFEHLSSLCSQDKALLNVVNSAVEQQLFQSAVFQCQSNDSMPTGAAKHRALEGYVDWPNRFSELHVNKHCSGQSENVKVLSLTGKVPGIYF